MEKNRLYGHARDILRGIEDVPMEQLTLGEALFLFRHCLRYADGRMQIVEGFGEAELVELLNITRKILARRDPRKVH